MATKKTGISADLLIPPGETIADILEARRMTQADLASATGAPSAYVGGVIAGQEEISADFADALERVFDVPKSFWMNLQSNYNAEVAEFRQADAAFSLSAAVRRLFGFPAKRRKRRL